MDIEITNKFTGKKIQITERNPGEEKTFKIRTTSREF